MPQPFSTSERCSINDSHNDAIAIIGMAARLAQDADTNENLWKFLLRNRNAMTPFPEDRLNHESHYHPDAHHGATVSKPGYNPPCNYIAILIDLLVFCQRFEALVYCVCLVSLPLSRCALHGWGSSRIRFPVLHNVEH